MAYAILILVITCLKLAFVDGTCGDGLVDPGEQCDCGNTTSALCNATCCNNATCLLVGPAQCASGTCCDLSSCLLQTATTVCRPAATVCDIRESCPGNNSVCPSDVYQPDFTPCTVSGVSSACYGGQCRSRESQCQYVYGAGTGVGDDLCYTSLNTKGNEDGSCGFASPNSYTSFVPCAAQDVMCGQLQCVAPSCAVQIPVVPFINAGNTCITEGGIVQARCSSVVTTTESAGQNAGFVPNGASCGTSMVCNNSRCVSVSSSSTPSGGTTTSICGDGLVQPGEQCDCGNTLTSECNQTCCNSVTCLLVGSAQCASGSCCDLSSCLFKSATTVCRPAATGCDVSESCSGSNSACPTDVYQPDFTPCSVGGVSSACYGGQCRSRESECQYVFGPGTGVGDDFCYTSLNTKGNTYGSCGFASPNSYTSFIPCATQDVMCGQLQCAAPSCAIQTPVAPSISTSTSCITQGSTQVRCSSIVTATELAGQNAGFVPNGASCGTSKVCNNNRCVSVSSSSMLTPVQWKTKSGVSTSIIWLFSVVVAFLSSQK
jgi:hypothetical protein